MEKKGIIGVIISVLVVILIIFLLFIDFTPEKESTKNPIFNETENVIFENQNETNVTSENITSNETVFYESENITKIKVLINYTNETIVFTESNRKLNLDENIADEFEDKIDENDVNHFFSIISDSEYTQEIKISNNIVLEEIEDDDINNGTKTTGFYFETDENILNYSIKFNNKLLDDLYKTEILFLGKNYYITEATENKIQLLELPYEYNMKENEKMQITYLNRTINLSISYFGESKIRLKIDDDGTESLTKGMTYEGDGYYIFIDDFEYSKKDTGFVDFVLASNKLVIDDDELVYNDNPIDNSHSIIYTEDDEIKEIKILWEMEDEYFFYYVNRLTMPFFNNIFFTSDNPRRDEDTKKYVDVTLNLDKFEIAEIIY